MTDGHGRDLPDDNDGFGGFEAEDDFVVGGDRPARPAQARPADAQASGGGSGRDRDDEALYQGPDGDETLEEMVQRLAAEAEQWKDAALRAKADAENTRRRAERELNDGKAYAIQRFAKDLLGVADNLTRALAATPAAEAEPAVKNLALGVEMVEKELQGAFERNGLKRIAPAAGDKFDPHVHQAVSEMPAEGVAPGAVANVMQVGYELFGRVVRPAMVVVAAKSVAAPNQQQGAGAYAKAAAATGDAMDRKA